MILMGFNSSLLNNGPVEIVDFPSYKMVDLSIIFCMFTRPATSTGTQVIVVKISR